MSEAKFTGGEWGIDDYLGIDGSVRVMFGNILISYHGHATEEDVANAHLIAAAPEMYKMLASLQVYNGSAGSVNLQISIDNLLAKARGEHE